MSLFTLVLAPGAVTAGTNIDLPAWAPKISELVAAILFTGSDGTAAASATALTEVTATPASGEIQVVDEDTIVLGDNTTTRDLLILVYLPKGEISGF